MPGLYKKLSLSCILVLTTVSFLCAQDLLSRRITFSASNQRLADVLKLISNKGDFYFSYNSNLINRDSIVSFSAADKPVKQVLDQLFSNSLMYRVRGNYIILRKAIAAPVVAVKTSKEEKLFTVSGYILNAETGERIPEASIYGKQQLVSALTNDQGYFTLKLKNRYGPALLTASKASYKDTSIYIEPHYNRQVTLALEPVQFKYSMVTVSPEFDKPDSITAAPDTISYIPVVKSEVKEVENTRVGKFLLSARQRIQSLNLGKFFADRPFQVSLIPGLGTQGKFSGQVVNNISLNIIGGYTGGSDGLELGGGFNINKTRVAGLQAAGLFNIAGGPASGIQMAGVANTVLNRVKGLQAAGVSNFTKGAFTGWQLSGVYNHTTDSVTGAQVAGAINYSRGNIRGGQVAGVANFSNRTISGVQIAGLINYTKRLKGVQIGLVNISDSSSGYSIGLINFVLKGYHKISISTNETMDVTLALKGGNSKLYSIMAVSASSKQNEKAYSYGYGFGRECNVGKWFSINPELVVHHVYLGSYEYGNILGNFSLQFNIKLGKFLTIFGGPSFNAFYSNQPAPMEGFKFELPAPGYNTFKLWDNRTTGWVGWNAGVAFF